MRRFSFAHLKLSQHERRLLASKSNDFASICFAAKAILDISDEPPLDASRSFDGASTSFSVSLLVRSMEFKVNH